MNNIKNFIIKYWPSALTLGVVLYATLFSDPLGDHEMPPIPHLDKLIHAIMMGGLYGAVAFDTQRANKSRRLSRRFLNTLAIVIMAFGIIDEIAQVTMGLGMSGDVLDLAADWTGVIIAYFSAPPTIRKVLGMKNEK